ncbi:hypothetical protein [Legionella sp. 16cNR16C]|uniref:hypothetical protein n=1 Tax=Legionella sp. 16cNR16C TaxID=2905656 RepID=UPI001E3083D0|nr:hypothetical protein [Legionella sp. 16cNR16C]MCE3046025.1 hypothetical protein [Legionella sp. 16cNR16C]
MAAYSIDSPVILFSHSEYGKRLLFKNGATNPRNELGKNGVTLHSGFGSLAYKTIKINAKKINQDGTEELSTFRVNRNSLIKYLGIKNPKGMKDADLIATLQSQFWTDDYENRDTAKAQGMAGERLRHAGEHNKRKISNWRNAIGDSLKGGFLSWLYKKTISGVNRIKARFLFVRTEKDIFEAGEVLAKKRAKQAYKEIPAYKEHLSRFNCKINSETTFSDLPVTTKENYIKHNDKHENRTHRHGKFPAKAKVDTSTGTTGKPTAWVRSHEEVELVKESLQLAAKIQFGDRKLHYIDAFALGPWATGLTTYELMRNTGSVFATGCDKEKILDELLRIVRYDTDLREQALDRWQNKHPGKITDGDKELIGKLIKDTLAKVLKNRDLDLYDALKEAFQQSEGRTAELVQRYKSEIRRMAAELNKDKQQIIIAGYPPFLKDLTAYVESKGYQFEDFSAIGVVGGQAISEAMRELLIEKGFNQVYSSYGASDLDINLGVETEFEIALRKALEKHPGLARELFGENKGIPMVFHYDTMNYHVECDEKNQLIFTCTHDYQSSQRARYKLGDEGRLYACSDVQAVMAKYGIFNKPKTNLPLMFVWGRESTVVYNGANLAFTELERAITDDEELKSQVLKKAFYVYHDDEGSEKMEMWLELNEGQEFPSEEEMFDSSQRLYTNLASVNQDFRWQLKQLDEGRQLPVIRYFKRGASPISETDGHHKQVLVFKQNANLARDYQFPDESLCRAVTVPMSGEILKERSAEFGI